MITIKKPSKIPLTLSRTGKQANDLNEQAYLRDPAYRKGEVDFDIKSSIYGYKTVKKRLREAQFNKCCFCEKEQSDEFAAVEHYRPWGGYKSAKTDELVKPGYYWLGYSWSNLYFVCNACNTCKANYFPLVDERHRASSHLHHVDRETPLLLDPAGPLNPLDHLTFDFQFIRSLSPHGEATIEICGLDRPALDEKRKLLIEILKAYVAIYQAPTSEIITAELQQEAADFLCSSQEPTGEFSSVAIAYLKRRNVQLD